MLTLAGGTLELSGSTLTANGGINWSNTSIIQNGTVVSTSQLNISAGINTLDSVTLNLPGNTLYSGGNLMNRPPCIG